MNRWGDLSHTVPLRKWMFQLSRTSRSQSAYWSDSDLVGQASKALRGEKESQRLSRNILGRTGGIDLWGLLRMGDASVTHK